ncbi:Serine/threonine-protein kinase LATS1; AltName: Full=Large tumor suppressor homolog 1; AltName: Full=WARTS protein kinase [Serendipita indica DSM 11827]|uniref:Related to serine/threonine protein kinase B-related Ukb1 n=1 Tax=Serendipita indica (strain DSM 11827) TaxID=1109443 RepID=G4T9E2_SERID|nr:Serine/threonine-protein kinase LATS1; AltName: Full=Large tumor suppressor homolog 1; AltName: Full=WARTS protein kinase [Serendipita indica DSM 11827]CCA67909.1 related to serine/threonine protein kinase B-related Ukb1 [Serendipita indica DSM 11827]
MPGILTRSTNNHHSESKFKTILGISLVQHSSHTVDDAAKEHPDELELTTTTPGTSLPRTASPSPNLKQKQSRTGRKLRARLPVEHKKSASHSIYTTPEPAATTETMPSASATIATKPTRAAGARPVRLDPEDGLWSVSVAHVSARFYNIYVKTPTHHLTLTRSSHEISELDSKIQDQVPSGTALPTCPLEAEPPQKRKSSFLTTLSRLASPQRPNQPLFNDDEPSDAFLDAEPSATTALAAYLTTLSNDKAVRTTRAWKRFVRVRTDDLESTRVERAIKRVRSDLAAHTTNSAVLGERDGTEGPGQSKDGEHVLDLFGDGLTPDDASATENARRLIDSGLMDFTSPAAPSYDTFRSTKRDTIRAPVSNAFEAPPTPDVHPEEKPAEALEAERSELGEEKKQEPAPDAPQATMDTPAPVEDVQAPVEEVPVEPNEEHEPAPAVPRPSTLDVDELIRRSGTWDDVESPLPPIQSETDAEETGVTDAEDTDAFGAGAASDVGGVDTADEAKPKKLQKKKKKKQKVERKSKKVVIDDFEMMRVLGKGCAGKVLLVRHKRSDSLYALKAITKRHVLAHQELQHTMTEQAVLKRMARSNTDPFVIKLYWSFHDKENLFLVMDFHPGGDLATQLARWGRLGRDRARFYAAEIVEGVEGLHAAGVIYRDLKPENILIGGDGHIVLTDFGLSRQFERRRPTSIMGGDEYFASSPATPTGETHRNGINWMNAHKESWLNTKGNDTTTTFCGTAEYLAPEVIQGLPYSYEVDWWSFGTMLYEMLTGITPFWANNHSDMYVRVLQDELTFPEDKAMDQDTKSLIRGLLQRNPALRLCEPRIKKHPYFSMIDWQHVYHKRYIPPYIPPIDPANASDTQNFDDAFLEMEPVLDTDLENETGSERDRSTTDIEAGDDDEALANGESPAVSAQQADAMEDDVFDGYSFKARNSVLIEDDGDDGNDGSDESDAASLTHEGPVDHHVEEELDPGQKTPEAGKPSTPTPASAVIEAFRKQEEERAAAAAATTTTATEEATSEAPVEEKGEQVAEHPIQSAPDPANIPVPLTPVTPTSKTSGLPSVEDGPKTGSPEKDLPAPPPAPGPQEAVVPTAPVKAPSGPKVPSKEERKTVTISEKPKHIKSKAPRNVKPTRRERSGVAALDRDLSDVIDEDDEVHRDPEDDDWDFVEAPGGEDYNGSQGKSLFARGVVDRYRLKVFRKPSSGTPSRPTQRNPSSTQSNLPTTDSEFGELVASTASPTLSEKKKSRGGGLSLRKPRTFLRPKSPSATYSAGSSKLSRPALLTQHSATISGSTSGILRTPSATTPLSALPTNGGLSLTSKPSMNSMGSPGSSDASVHNEPGRGSLTQSAAELAATPSKPRGNKSSPDLRRQARESDLERDDTKQRPLTKMRKYTEQGAEKVMSLFSSPRPSASASPAP